MRVHKAIWGAAAAVALVVGGIAPAANAAATSAAPTAAAGVAAAVGDPVVACESLLEVDLGANVTVESAVQDAGTETTPASCRVQVATTHPPADDKVTIWVYLPTTGWNGRFLGVGGGGFSGGTAESLVAPLSQGYAAGATDAGNPARTAAAVGMNPDGTINWVGQENFGNRGIHEMTVNGKALVQAYYGQAQDHAYFSGCSTGGRQGSMEAQKYPLDYDGITAGAPVLNYPRMQIAQLWSQVVMLEEDNVLSQCKLDTVLAAVTAECDTVGDGVADGVIGDPLGCEFDYASLIGTVAPCGETITAEDVAVLEAIRQGPRGSEGQFLWYGLVPGAPYQLTASQVVDGELVGAPFGNPVQVIAYWLEQNPDWDWRTETYESFEAHMAEAVELYDDVHGASNADIRPFVDAGGKLLLWHGYADFGVYTQGTIDYYERVQDIVGEEKTADSVRLFLAPGVGHCRGGLGAQPTEQLENLVRWVEEGQAPETLPGVRTQDGQVIATRPICAYPEVARYDGTGNVNEASNYACAPATQLTPGEDPDVDDTPVNVAPPVISGTPDVGSMLTVSPGEWEGADLTVTYQWLRNGSPVAGATGTTYVPTTGDQGTTLSVQVTATNADGTATATSNEVVVRYRSAVLVTTNPFLLGTTGKTVTVNVTVFPATAGGEVTATVGGKTLTGTVSGGRASLDVGKLPRGVHLIRVDYAGSDTVAPSVGYGLIIILR